ncbi:DUF1036 domain-containing protein [Aquimarina longa]|uniref:DUF1036 domain-containing protein n=1 Tax=Aquimarina longa TaxID=1080221 RepID=UPI0007833A0B|nr:DUF1036 domain-containing protein [Aquimarina longa]
MGKIKYIIVLVCLLSFTDIFSQKRRPFRNGARAIVAKEIHNNKSYFGVKLKNNCHKKISVAICYMNLNNDWVTTGWWSLDGYSEITTDVKTKNKNLYFYAADSYGYEWNGEGESGAVRLQVTPNLFNAKNKSNLNNYYTEVSRESFFMRTVSSGIHTQSFSCN